jgi:hypothetical protein
MDALREEKSTGGKPVGSPAVGGGGGLGRRRRLSSSAGEWTDGGGAGDGQGVMDGEEAASLSSLFSSATTRVYFRCANMMTQDGQAVLCRWKTTEDWRLSRV